MRKITEVTRLKRENLVTLAQSEGLTIEEDATKNDIIAAMQEQGLVDSKAKDDSVDTPVEQSSDEQDSGVKKFARRSPFANEDHVYITIHSSDTDDGARPVDVSVNGYNYRIPRDKEVHVPRPVLQVLENAVETRLEEVGRDQVTGAPRFHERHSRRFAFSSRAA